MSKDYYSNIDFNPFVENFFPSTYYAARPTSIFNRAIVGETFAPYKISKQPNFSAGQLLLQRRGQQMEGKATVQSLSEVRIPEQPGDRGDASML